MIYYLLLSASLINAQDVIFMTSGEQRSVIVKKVGISTIEYVRYDNQSGALYEVLKDDVFKIVYENGVEDVFHTELQENINYFGPDRRYGMFYDERDSTCYKTVVIGHQTWMAENLRFNINTGFRRFTVNDCDACCVFYKFDHALKACPEGWHLPDDQEWIELEVHLGMHEAEANKIGWRGTYPGQASKLLRKGTSGLDLYLCGYYPIIIYEDIYKVRRDHSGLDKFGYYWTATEENQKKAYYRQFTGRASIYRKYFDKDNLLPVRCVKD